MSRIATTRRSASLCLPVVVVVVVAVVGLVLVPGLPASADEGATVPAYRVGDTVDAFTLEDQHGETASVDATTRIVLFSRDMEGGEILKAALEDVSAETLAGRGAVYVSDISGMPSLVATLFALPAMRGRPYDMLLDRDGQTTARLPDVVGRATLIHLSDGRIERLLYASDIETVLQSLGIDATGDDS